MEVVLHCMRSSLQDSIASGPVQEDEEVAIGKGTGFVVGVHVV